MRERKKFLQPCITVILFLFILLALPTNVQAATYSGSDKYSLNWTFDDSNGKLEISTYNSSYTSMGRSDEPKNGKLDDYMKKYGWYKYKEQIKTVVVKDDVTVIGIAAFRGYKNLTSVQIPSSVTDIDADAFEDCSLLSTVTFTGNSTLGCIWQYAFAQCTNLKTIQLPVKMRWGIGLRAFEGSGLTSVTIPECGYGFVDGLASGVGSLSLNDRFGNSYHDGVSAFRDCTSLQTVTFLGNNYDVIEDSMFRGCTNLKTVKLSPKTQRIKGAAFYGCENLNNININEETYFLGDNAFNGCKALKDVKLIYHSSIPYDKVSDVIGPDCFKGCDNLVLTVYAPSAFYEYAKANKVKYKLSNGDYIGMDKFAEWYVDELQDELVISGIGATVDYETAGPWSTNYRDDIGTVTIGEGITSIGTNAFNGLTNLKLATLPDSLESINAAAFKNCKNLEEITISENVKTIGEGAFAGCNRLEIITTDGSVAAEYAYQNHIKCSAKSQTELKEEEDAKKVQAAEAQKQAADHEAANAVSDKIDNIGTVTEASKDAIEAARNAYNALTADQKALVTNVEVLTKAEEDLKKITNAKPAEPVKDPESTPTPDPTPTLDPTTPGITTPGAPTQNQGGTTQNQGTTDSSATEVKTGDTVNDDNTNTSYVITSTETNNETVTYITTTNNTASTLAVPDTVTVSGKEYKVTEIKADAFKNNKKLKKITIGKNIEKIGKNAFSGCKNLKNVNIKTVKLTKKTVGANAFKGINAKAKVKVPKSKLKDYKSILKARGIKGKNQKITK